MTKHFLWLNITQAIGALIDNPLSPDGTFLAIYRTNLNVIFNRERLYP
jgi:hypothetical protein